MQFNVYQIVWKKFDFYILFTLLRETITFIFEISNRTFWKCFGKIVLIFSKKIWLFWNAPPFFWYYIGTNPSFSKYLCFALLPVNPIKVKTAESIWPEFFVPAHIIPGKVVILKLCQEEFHFFFFRNPHHLRSFMFYKKCLENKHCINAKIVKINLFLKGFVCVNKKSHYFRHIVIIWLIETTYNQHLETIFKIWYFYA